MKTTLSLWIVILLISACGTTEPSAEGQKKDRTKGAVTTIDGVTWKVDDYALKCNLKVHPAHTTLAWHLPVISGKPGRASIRAACFRDPHHAATSIKQWPAITLPQCPGNAPYLISFGQLPSTNISTITHRSTCCSHPQTSNRAPGLSAASTYPVHLIGD